MSNRFLLSRFAKLRKFFGKVSPLKPMEMPNLVNFQVESYNKFLQLDTKPSERDNSGLQNALDSIFSLKNNSGTMEMKFVSYTINRSKYLPEECKERGITYSGTLVVCLMLRVFEKGLNGEMSLKNVVEQDVYIGDIPLITDKGTFIINGHEKVFTLQIRRAPGIIYTHDEGKTNIKGLLVYSAIIIPQNGFWLTVECRANGLLMIKVDKTKRCFVTTLLRALGWGTKEILESFYKKEKCIFDREIKKWKIGFDARMYKNLILPFNVHDESNQTILTEGIRISPKVINECSKYENLYCFVDDPFIVGRYAMDKIVTPNDEVIFDYGDQLTAEMLAKVVNETDIGEIFLLKPDDPNGELYLLNTLLADNNKTYQDAVMALNSTFRGGTQFEGNPVVDTYFSDKYNWNLGVVGRNRVNAAHKRDIVATHLVIQDIVDIVVKLMQFTSNMSTPDSSDSLINRRISSIGEAITMSFAARSTQMNKSNVEKLTTKDGSSAVNPTDCVNPKPILNVFHENMNTSLCNQANQTNPVATMSDARRVSAYGKNGVDDRSASVSLRETHPSHYSKLCAIETPEGKNIGLINNLSIYARIDENGFLISPFRRVENGVVTDDIEYLTASKTMAAYIAKANEEIDENKNLINEYISCKNEGDIIEVPKSKVEYIEVAAHQSLSVSAANIPFNNHCDSTRALTGSNMQRQMLSPIKPSSPWVGTGMEGTIAINSFWAVTAKSDGYVVYSDAKTIITQFNERFETYNLIKFRKTNQSTCYNHKPLVEKGDRVIKGEVIADNGTQEGEVALGQNVLVAYVSWWGYNYEDAIIVSHRLVREGYYTNLQVKKVTCIFRETKNGPEYSSNDLYGYSREQLSHLDENGIVRIGTYVSGGMVLVGKQTPERRNEKKPLEMQMFEDLLGIKSDDVKNSCLLCPPNLNGIVIDVTVFIKDGMGASDDSIPFIAKEIVKINHEYKRHVDLLNTFIISEIKKIILEELPELDLVKENLDIAHLDKLKKNFAHNELISSKIDELKQFYTTSIKELDAERDRQKSLAYDTSSSLGSNELKSVNVYIAAKKKLTVGDKMAGRHGNKGVISKIVADEDMPYLEDGTPVDMILNPLGVPSRMNIGQVLEVKLGYVLYFIRREIDNSLQNVINSNYSQSSIESLRNLILRFYNHDHVNVDWYQDQEEENRLGNWEAVFQKSFSKSEKSTSARLTLLIKKKFIDFFKLEAHEYIPDDLTKITTLTKSILLDDLFSKDDMITVIKNEIEKLIGREIDLKIVISFVEKLIQRKKQLLLLKEEILVNAIKEDRLCYNKERICQVIEMLGINDLCIVAEQIAKDGPRVATQVFNGATNEDIENFACSFNIKPSEQMPLYCGITGEKLLRNVSVGVLFVTKLNHLASEKRAERGNGKYAQITQQASAGIPNRGGQRVGEMEVWALNGHGAGYLQNSILTICSDSVEARRNAYASICQTGDAPLHSQCTTGDAPESTYVLVSEMRALGFEIKQLNRDDLPHVGNLASVISDYATKLDENPKLDENHDKKS